MLVKKIEYTDYNGTPRNEEFRFNLTEAEVFKWLHGTVGDYTLDKALEKMSQDANGKEIIKTVEDLILMSYGEVSLDGKRFIKSEEMSEAFKQTEAYTSLFMELVTDARKTANFIQAIIPKSMMDTYSDLVSKNMSAEETEKVTNMPVSNL